MKLPCLPSFSFQNMVVLLMVFVMVFLLCFDFMKRRKKWGRYPPGPNSMPFLGNMLQMDFNNPVTSFDKFRKTYGDVYSLQFCWTHVVVLNGFEVMKEALIQKSEDIADRPPFPIFDHQGINKYSEGILTARYGTAWKEQRRFSLSTLRNFGLGKKSLEDRVIEEARFLCSSFQSQEGRLFDPRFLLSNAVGNVISTIIFGDRFEYGDERFKTLLHLLEESMEAETGFLPQLMNVVPVLVHFPGIVQKLLKPERDLLNCISDYTQEHKVTREPSILRDGIDAFLEEIEKAKDKPHSSFNEKNLLFTIADLFAAGTDTTSTTLRWGLLFMLLHPDIQSMIFKCRSSTPRNRSGDWAESVSCHEGPGPNAVHHGCDPRNSALWRYSSGSSPTQRVPRHRDTWLLHPKVLKDETVWEKPHQFYPENFLDVDGNFVKRDAFMAFSAGRRVCVGEQLARMELFIFFTSLLQQFTFTVPDGQKKPQEDAIFAITRGPHPYQICAKMI